MGFPCRDIAFYVATVGQGVASQQGRVCARQRRSVAQDSPWVLETVWRCVASQQRRPCTRDRPGQARTTGLGVHRTRHRDASATEVFCHNKLLIVANSALCCKQFKSLFMDTVYIGFPNFQWDLE